VPKGPKPDLRPIPAFGMQVIHGDTKGDQEVIRTRHQAFLPRRKPSTTKGDGPAFHTFALEFQVIALLGRLGVAVDNLHPNAGNGRRSGFGPLGTLGLPVGLASVRPRDRDFAARAEAAGAAPSNCAFRTVTCTVWVLLVSRTAADIACPR